MGGYLTIDIWVVDDRRRPAATVAAEEGSLIWERSEGALSAVFGWLLDPTGETHDGTACGLR